MTALSDEPSSVWGSMAACDMMWMGWLERRGRWTGGNVSPGGKLRENKLEAVPVSNVIFAQWRFSAMPDRVTRKGYRG